MRQLSRPRFLALALLTVVTMLPVTAVVPVLKPLIADRYGVRDLAASTFMSLNMAGALVAAPFVGRLSDGRGWTRRLLVPAALLDAALWWGMAAGPEFWLLSLLRLVEGATHIAVLSLLLAAVSRSCDEGARRLRMAAMGGAVVLGVAAGAPLGGLVGGDDPGQPLRLGALAMIGVAAFSLLLVPSLRVRQDGSASTRLPRLVPSRALQLPYAFAFVDRLTVGFFVYAFPMYTARVLDLSPADTGALIGVFMLPFALLCYPAGRLGARVGQWRLVLGGSIAYGVAYAAIPWLSGPSLWVVMFAGGVLSALMFGPTLVVVVERSTPATRASAMAGFNAAGSVGFLVGPLAAGALLQVLAAHSGDALAARATFAVAAIFQLLAVAWAIGRLRQEPGDALGRSAPPT